MKGIQKLLTVVVMAIATVPAFAQVNIGHCNTDSILVKMPEYQTAMSELEALSAQYQGDLNDMQTEVSSRVQTAQANRGSWSELRLRREAQEIDQLQTSMEEFAREAQQDLATQERTKLAPIINKLQEAIDKVGAEQGYDYILDSSPNRGVVIFRNKSRDVTNEVLAALGLL